MKTKATSPAFVQEALASYQRSGRSLAAYQREQHYTETVLANSSRKTSRKLATTLEVYALSCALGRIETDLKEYMKASSL